MGTLSYDFTAASVENPISIGGDWETAFNSGVEIALNDVNNNAASRLIGTVTGSNITTTKASYGAKQYAEIIIGANWPSGYGIGPACFINGNNAYYLQLITPSGTTSNRIYKNVAGVATNLTWTGSTAINVGDKVGLLAEEVAGTTTLSFYLNPTTYDGDGFPTNGFSNSITDTDLTSGQVGLVGSNTSNSDQAYATDFYSAGAVASGATITSNDATARRGQTNYNLAISGGSASQGTATVDINGSDCPITTYPAGGTGTIVCTIPATLAELYDATAVLTYSDDDGSSVPTAAVSFLPASTDDYIVSADPLNLTEYGVYYGYNGQAPRAGQNITHTVLTSVTGKTFDVNPDSTWTLSEPVTVVETVEIFITDIDGTVGATKTFTLSPGGGGAFLGLITDIVNDIISPIDKLIIN